MVINLKIQIEKDLMNNMQKDMMSSLKEIKS